MELLEALVPAAVVLFDPVDGAALFVQVVELLQGLVVGLAPVAPVPPAREDARHDEGNGAHAARDCNTDCGSLGHATGAGVRGGGLSQRVASRCARGQGIRGR